jgi:putative transposase
MNAIVRPKDQIRKDYRMRIIRWIDKTYEGGSILSKARAFDIDQQNGAVPDQVKQWISQAVCRAGKTVSPNTVHNWAKKLDKAGVEGLSAAYCGRSRTTWDWEAEALKRYQVPTRPGFAKVARDLQRAGHDTATEKRVERYLKSVPLLEREKGRRSADELRKELKPFIRRSLENIEANTVWMADGHTVDVRMLHPHSRKLYRPEVTVFMDVKSRLVVGAFVSEKENQYAVMWAFSRGVKHFGLPLFLYTDGGAGYVAKAITATGSGLLDRLGVDWLKALPYNARAKAQVERFFRFFSDDFAKGFATYCGDDMSKDHERRMVTPKAADREKVQALYPEQDEFVEQMRAWLHWYNTERIHPELGCTPMECWQAHAGEIFQAEHEALLWPREARVVQRGEIHFNSLIYRSIELNTIDHGTEVWVEYDPWDGRKVRVLDKATEAWLCDAEIDYGTPIIPTARIEQAREKARLRSERLQQIRMDEKQRRWIQGRDATDITDEIHRLETQPNELNELHQPGMKRAAAGGQPTAADDDDDIDIDILDTNY